MKVSLPYADICIRCGAVNRYTRLTVSLEPGVPGLDFDLAQMKVSSCRKCNGIVFAFPRFLSERDSLGRW